jgi:hypothetical protein
MVDPRRLKKNFGGKLSIWDHIFNFEEAVDAPEQRASTV